MHSSFINIKNKLYLITILITIEWFKTKEKVKKGLKNFKKIIILIYRILKKRGRAYLTFKSPTDEKEMKYLSERASVYESVVYIDNGQMRSRFTKEKLHQLLAKSGISEARVEPHSEDIGVDDKGNPLNLYVNEIVFTKV